MFDKHVPGDQIESNGEQEARMKSSTLMIS